eukprot:gene8304-biopygen6716
MNVTLKDVLYVPKLQSKLFSLSLITEKGVPAEFHGKACGIKIGEQKYIIGHKNGKLYKLNTISDETCCIGKANVNEKPELWHQRYGHLGYDNLKQLNRKKMVNGLNFDIKEATDRSFEGCAMGRQHRQPFPKNAKSSTSKILELIHSDVCGPINVPSVGGSRYLLTFIDDLSRYTTVYIIKQKSEVLERFKEL